MAWTKDHDILLCREIVAVNPYKVKPGSRERGELLQKIVDTLNGIQKPSFRIDARSIRDRINKLLAKFIDKQREEERASGISAEYDELDQLLQEIKDLKEDSEREIAETDEKKNKKLEEDKESADSIRRRSLERMSETRKRESSDETFETSTPAKSRNNGSETVNFLREKSERDSEYKMQELDIRKQELLLRQKQEESSRQQTQLLMQQQQQQSQALLLLIQKLTDKNN